MTKNRKQDRGNKWKTNNNMTNLSKVIQNYLKNK